MDNSICAGIVTFNPKVDRLRENLNKIACQVNRVYIYDNGSSNLDAIKKTISEFDNCKGFFSKKNNGIAWALNYLTCSAEHDGFSWILTLDQDSVCPSNMIEVYMVAMANKKAAVFCPLLVDKRRKDISFVVPSTAYTDVSYTPTSGSLVNIETCRRIGGYDNYLFVGLVDVDFCKRLSLNNYKLVRCNEVILDQEFGNIAPSKHEKLFLKIGDVLKCPKIKKLSYTREVSPFRVKYAVRNRIYLVKKYRKINNAKKELIKLFIGNVITVLRSKEKIKVLRAIALGYSKGRKCKVNEYECNN